MDARVDAAGRAAMDQTAQLLAQYGFDPDRWAGIDDALYSRHLIFDNAGGLTAVGHREHFVAIARSVRDLLSQRWLETKLAYKRQHPNRIYCVSRLSVIVRSQAKNLTNLMLEPVSKRVIQTLHLDLAIVPYQVH